MSEPRRTRLRRFGLPQLWAVVILGVIFAVLNLHLVSPNDFWWHVRTGQWIVVNGRVPTADLFSYTRPGQPYANAPWWLMQAALYLLVWAGGLPLAIFAHAVAMTAAYALVLRVCQTAAGGELRWAALGVVAAAGLGLSSWNVRPQMISFLLFALVLWILERLPAPGRAGWLLPPLFALWANAHAGYTAGLVLLGAHLLGQLAGWLKRDHRFPARPLLIAALSASATLINPQGLDRLRYLAEFSRNTVVRTLIAEWVPLSARELDGKLFLALVAALAALFVVSRHRPTPFAAIRLILFGILAAMARRNIPYFGMAAAPTLAAALAAWQSSRAEPVRPRSGRPLLNLAIATLVGLLVALSLPWFRPHLPLPESRREYVWPNTPVQAVEFVRRLPPTGQPDGPPRRVFHSEGTGSYMTWASPELPVFIDPRFEFYPESMWRDYLALGCARYDWQAILDRYGVDTLLLDVPDQAPLAAAARASPLWELAYSDDRTVVFLRRGAP